MDTLLEWLQNVYVDDFCDGSWEHEHGISIENIDSPGWDFTFDLRETDLENSSFNEINFRENDMDWYQCWKESGRFRGWGGAKNLVDILQVFKDWYTKVSAIADERNADKGS